MRKRGKNRAGRLLCGLLACVLIAAGLPAAVWADESPPADSQPAAQQQEAQPQPESVPDGGDARPPAQAAGGAGPEAETDPQKTEGDGPAAPERAPAAAAANGGAEPALCAGSADAPVSGQSEAQAPARQAGDAQTEQPQTARCTVVYWGEGLGEEAVFLNSWNDTGDPLCLYYARNEYTLHLVNGETTTEAKTEYEAPLAEALPAPNPPEDLDDGSEFAGWYLSREDGSQPFDSTGGMPAHDLILYARWQPTGSPEPTASPEPTTSPTPTATPAPVTSGGDDGGTGAASGTDANRGTAVQSTPAPLTARPAARPQTPARPAETLAGPETPQAGPARMRITIENPDGGSGGVELGEETTPLTGPARHESCVLHHLILLAAFVLELLYISEAKKAQRRVFNARIELAEYEARHPKQ